MSRFIYIYKIWNQWSHENCTSINQLAVFDGRKIHESMTFNLVWYLEPCICRCAVSPRGYHPSISSQYFGIDMVYYMYLCLKFTLIKWCNLLKLIPVFLWNIGYYSRFLLFCLCPLVDMLIKTFKLFGLWQTGEVYSLN
jgi:hypothetical protein